MNNFGRTVLALGLSTVMTFTNPGCFFQADRELISVHAAEEKTSQSRTAAQGDAESGLEEGESTIEVTTQKKEETTTATSSKEDQTSSENNTGSTGDTEASKSESTTGSSTGEEDTRHTESTATDKTKKHTGEAPEASAPDTSETSGKKNEDSTSQNPEKKISSREASEIKVEKSAKDIRGELAEESAPGGSDRTSTFIPKIYNDTRLAMKNNKEYIAGYVYFNQTDSAWNQNGYCIAKAGCGPTSMAVVITSLTGKWVTPLDTAIWGYRHGFYSREGSAHEMIPAMAAAYGLKCQGAGTNYNAIKNALKAGNPVVCLMGPGYFTRGGHFMVLVAIDKNDCVTVADVGSRTRSAYKYRLSDVIAQSKGAGAGGPFWIISGDKKSGTKCHRTQAIKDYTQEDLVEDFADASYMKLKGELSDTLKQEKKDVSVKKVVSILTMSTGKSLFDTVKAGKRSALAGFNSSTSGVLAPISQDKQVVITDKDPDSRKALDPAVTLKQDIAKRQWEKRLDLSWMDDYLRGTLKKPSL